MAKLGLFSIRTEIDGSQRTVVLVPDDCVLEPQKDSHVEKLTNIQIMGGGDGILRCADTEIDISLAADPSAR